MTMSYWVYVVELACPASEGRRCCVYVGETATTPIQRFRQHLSGYKDSGRVRRRGVRVLRRLSRQYATRAEAERGEHEMARRLRAMGWAVYNSV